MRVRSLSAAGLVLTFLMVASVARAHETPEMLEAQNVSGAWMNDVLSRDRGALAGALSADVTADISLAASNHFADGDTFLDYLMHILREFPVSKVNWKYAFFSPAEGTLRAGPIIVAQGSGAEVLSAWYLDLVRADSAWKIRHVAITLEGVPRELVEVPRPEQHAGQLVTFQVHGSPGGPPLASRVSLRDAAGRYWPPRGHRYDVPTGWREDVGSDVRIQDRTYALVGGEFAAELPPGRYQIDVSHGMEFVPRSVDFEVQRGLPTRVEIALERWVNMNAAGWYSGDTHVHFVRPHAAALEGRAEGVNVVNILAAKWANLITNVDDFSGAIDPVSGSENIVYVNEEARHGYLGHTALLGLKQLVFPLSWGSGPLTGVPGGSDYPPMASLADDAHRQGALVSWAHFPNPRGEVAVDVALGKIDSVDVLTWGDPLQRKGGEPSRADAWYGLLNCGFRLPITAGTDKMFNSQIIGTPRVYVRLDGQFDYLGWLDGIRRGRTFATTGPMLSLTVDGEGIGATLTRARGARLSVTAQAHSWLPMSALEIVVNGVVAARADARRDRKTLDLTAQVTVSESSWIAARVLSDATLPSQTVYLDRAEDIPVFAHTSPVYVDIEGRPRRSAADAQLFIRWIDQGIDWLRKQAHVDDEAERREMVALFERARAIYAAQVEKPN